MHGTSELHTSVASVQYSGWPLRIEGMKLYSKVMMGCKFPSFPAKGQPVFFEGFFNFFHLAILLCLEVLVLSCCTWSSSARYSFRYVVSQGGRGWKRTTRCLWEQAKSSRRPGIMKFAANLWIYGNLEGFSLHGALFGLVMTPEGPAECFSTAQWVEPHHLWWVLLGLHG